MSGESSNDRLSKDAELLVEVKAQSNDLRFSAETLKWGSLIVLWLQNCTFWVLSFYTRQFPTGGKPYLSSTIVVTIEAVKIIGCSLAIVVSSGRGFQGLYEAVQKEIVDDMWTTIKVGVPAFAYTVSNNCLFMATLYLDASTAQILYQGKLLTTAGCAVLILGSTLSKTKWCYLVMLTAGAMVVQMNASSKSQEVGVHHDASTHGVTGFSIVMLGCFCSSSAGVYFEKMLKGSTTSIWMRNVQLGIFSILVGSFGMLVNDYDKIQEGGFFQGYDSTTWILVFVQACGGLLVAFACKYANNIMKNFACTLSIVLSTLILSVRFPEHSPLSGQFLLGGSLVLAATYLYGAEDSAGKAKSASPRVEGSLVNKGAYQPVPARAPKDIGV